MSESVSHVTVWSLKCMTMPNSPRRSLPWTIIISYELDDSQRLSVWNAQEKHICSLRLNSGSENVTNICQF
jgi:hypothetical protein